MSSGIDPHYVKEAYQRMSDDELIRIATQDAYGLTPEAMEIVKAEIRKRGLDENLALGIDAQNKTYTLEDINAYCDLISNLTCPICNSTIGRLNATMTGEVMSFLFFTSYSKKIKIGCPQCLEKANVNALIKTAFLGWWGFPWGFIRTRQAIILNIKSKRKSQLSEHNDYLRSFVLGTIGELETYKSDKARLQLIISMQNNL